MARGVQLVESVMGEHELADWERVAGPVAPGHAGRRNLLDDARAFGLAESVTLRRLVEPVLGISAFPVRALLFDKSPTANWRVAFHQDLAIAVRWRAEVEGFSGWSVKQGVPHVLAPADVLERMLAVRVHLDDCGPRDGALRVIEGSHLAGRIDENDIDTWCARVPETTCLARRGDVLLMRPLLLHASSPAESPSRRRVVHVEYAACMLPEPLEWRWAPRGVA